MSLKAGDLVRFAPWPHEELHRSGMIGLVIREPYEFVDSTVSDPVVDAMWSAERSHITNKLGIGWDYVSDLEVISKNE